MPAKLKPQSSPADTVFAADTAASTAVHLMHRSLLRRANVGYGRPRAAYDRWLTNLPVGSERCLLHIQSVPSIFLLHTRRKPQSGRMSTKKDLIGIFTGAGDA